MLAAGYGENFNRRCIPSSCIQIVAKSHFFIPPPIIFAKCKSYGVKVLHCYFSLEIAVLYTDILIFMGQKIIAMYQMLEPRVLP